MQTKVHASISHWYEFYLCSYVAITVDEECPLRVSNQLMAAWNESRVCEVMRDSLVVLILVLQ